jgi:hypothetical protein
LATAETAADMTFSLLFHSARANRLVEHHSRDARLMSLESVIDRVMSATIKAAPKNGHEGAIQMAVDYALFTNLAKLALNKDAASSTKAITFLKLDQVKGWLAQRAGVATDEEWKAFYQYLSGQIGRLQDDPDEYKQENLLPAPPGAPIGDFDLEFCGN